MLRSCLLVATLVAAPVAARGSAAADRDERTIVAAMADSAAGWNAGDVARFMAVYSDAPTTSFVTSRGLLRGKAAMIESYRRRYDFSNAAKRGTLSFTTLDFRHLGTAHALYVARYTLTYPDGRTDSGPTSLIFARERGGWHIVADHSG